MDVKTVNVSGKTRRNPYETKTGELYKDDDYKVAWVTLPKNVTFDFPDVTKPADDKEESLEKQEKKAQREQDVAKKIFVKSHGIMAGKRKGIPIFFGL